MNPTPGPVSWCTRTAALAIGWALVGCGSVPRVAPGPVAEAIAPAVVRPLETVTAAALPGLPASAANPSPDALAAMAPAEPASAASAEVAPAPAPQVGIASWYGRPFHGRRTANGERYNMHAMTAAHPTLPMASWVLVRHLASRREVLLRVNDRGPFKWGRIIDLSRAAAQALGILGVATVEVHRVAGDDPRVAAAKAVRTARESRAVAPRAAPRSVATRPHHAPDEASRRGVSASAARRSARSG
ncbi:MAG: septal ring lytic transglycosylase RlpA family protein [Burkholderiaceae bacterium]